MEAVGLVCEVQFLGENERSTAQRSQFELMNVEEVGDAVYRK